MAASSISRQARFRKIFCILLAFIIAISFCIPFSSVQAIAQTVNTAESDFLTSGDGSSSNPYKIDSEEDLIAFSTAVNGCSVVDGAWVASGESAQTFEGKKIVLTADINLTNAFTPIGIGKYNVSSYVTITEVSFKGIFDGQGHSINNFYCNESSNPEFTLSSEKSIINNHKANCFSALFGSINGATIQNLNLVLAQDANFGKYGAGIAGIVYGGDTEISCVSVTGNVASNLTSSNVIGGIVGIYAPSKTASLKIAYCFHNGKVSSTMTAGGFIGSISNTGVSISSSYQYGEVSSSYSSTSVDRFWGVFIGGGSAQSPAIENCATDQDGQLVGQNITNATTTNCITGIIDTWNSDAIKAALGSDCYIYYADGATPPTLLFGSAKVSYPITFEYGADDVFGALPTADKVEEASEYTIPASSLTRRGYNFAGWMRTSAQADSKIYKAGDAFTMPSEAVTFTAQWTQREVARTFSTEQDLRTFASAVNSGSIDTTGEIYKLEKDIKLSSAWTPIGSEKNQFCGIFDGGGHTISGLNVTDASIVAGSDAKNTYAGFFGYIDGATIKNLGVSGSVSSSAYYSGGLVGMASAQHKSSATSPELVSTIESCFSRVKVTGSAYVGGLAGYLVRTQISNSYSSGSVCTTSSGGIAGGLVGCYKTLPDKEIIALNNCYSSALAYGTSGSSAHIACLIGAISETYAKGSSSAAWAFANNTYVLSSSLPAFIVETSAGNYVDAASTVSEVYYLSKEELVAAANSSSAKYLGSAFQAEGSSKASWINDGYPLLAWESIPSVRTAEISISPASAKVVLTNNETGMEVASTSSSVSQSSTLYTYDLNASAAYTLKVSAVGYTEQSCTIDATEGSGTINKEVKLEAIAYSIAYDMAGGEFVADYAAPKSFTVESGAIELPSASNIKRAGCIFEGWYLYSDYQGSAIENIDSANAQNYTLYAKWRAATRVLKLSIEPNSAIVKVMREDTGEAVQPQEDGSYVLGVLLQYSVEVSCDGYYTQNFSVEAGNEDIAKTVALEAVPAPEPEPEPQPTPTPEPDPDPDPDPDQGGDQDPQPTPDPDQGGDTDPDPQPQPQPDPDSGTDDGQQKVINTRLSAGQTFNVGALSCVVQSGAKTVFIKAKNKKVKKLYIPTNVKDSRGNSYIVTGIAKSGFKNCKKLKKVSGGLQLGTISSKAFFGCKNLKTFSVGSKLKTVKTSAFAKCKKLKKLTIKSNLLSKKSFKNILKKSNIKKINCKKVNIKVKKNYKKWVKKYKKDCKLS